MTPLERFQQLKQKSDSLQQQISRAEGALEQHLSRLRQEHDCNSIKEARTKLRSLEEKAATAEEQFAQAADEFETKWAEVLGAE
jgi:septation ring formation regulator EzrA